MKKTMIAWVKYQRRADCMKDYWGYDLHHIHTSVSNSKLLKPIDYLIKVAVTLLVLIRDKPLQLWIQLPPGLLLHIAILYKKSFRRECVIIADLHNSMLRHKWINFPFARNLLNKMDYVIAHNQAVSEELFELGVRKDIIYVLEDYPFKYEIKNDMVNGGKKAPYLIFPCSFDVDEPVEMVLEAARLVDMDFYITGDYSKFVKPDDFIMPDNVVFTGYLSKSDYESLLLNSSIVLGLTERDNVQLSVANEGVSAGKPLVLSRTKVLVDLYSDAAKFVDNNDPSSLAAGINEAIDEYDYLVERTINLLRKRADRWVHQAKAIKLT